MDDYSSIHTIYLLKRYHIHRYVGRYISVAILLVSMPDIEKEKQKITQERNMQNQMAKSWTEKRRSLGERKYYGYIRLDGSLMGEDVSAITLK